MTHHDFPNKVLISTYTLNIMERKIGVMAIQLFERANVRLSLRGALRMRSAQARRRSNLNTGLPRYARNDKQNGLLHGVYNEHFCFLSTGSATKQSKYRIATLRSP